MDHNLYFTGELEVCGTIVSIAKNYRDWYDSLVDLGLPLDVEDGIKCLPSWETVEWSELWAFGMTPEETLAEYNAGTKRTELPIWNLLNAAETKHREAWEERHKQCITNGTA